MVQDGKPARGADPYIAGAVGNKAIDMIATPVALAAAVKNAYFIAVETIEAMLGAHPDKTVFVLCNSVSATL